MKGEKNFCKAVKHGNRGKAQICFFIGFEQDIYCGSQMGSGLRNDWWNSKGNDSRVCAGITVCLVFSWIAWNLGQGVSMCDIWWFGLWHPGVHWWVILVLCCLHCIGLEKVLAGFSHIYGGSVLYVKFVLFSHLPSVWGAHFHCFIVFSMMDILIHWDPDRHLYSEKP